MDALLSELADFLQWLADHRLMGVFFVGLILFVLGLLLLLGCLRIYAAARMAGAPVPLVSLLSMRFRRIPLTRVVEPHIILTAAGFPDNLHLLENHQIFGGNPQSATLAFLKANREGIPLTLTKAMAIDLAGHDPERAVEEWVEQGVDTPSEIDRWVDSQNQN